jgi:hypothetical protein
MKKVFYLMLTLIVLSVASVNAQVRIGGSSDPSASAILDLNADSTTTTGKLGLALPRVALTSTTDVATIKIPKTGLTVYNLATAGTGATAVVPGVYVFNGTSWTRSSATSAPVITVQPKSFSFSRLQNTIGDPNGPATATVAALSVTAAGSGTLTYAWYEKPKNMNVTARGTKLASTASYAPPVTAWGMRSYYCVVSNGTDSVVSNVADVAIGCGAKTMDGRWLSFMCQNLGAAAAPANLDAITFATNSTIPQGDTISSDAKGWLFQWGRLGDGHQWRSAATVAGPVYLPTQDQAPATGTSGTSASLGITTAQTYANYYGKFITTSGYEFFHDWRTPQVGWLWYSYRS